MILTSKHLPACLSPPAQALSSLSSPTSPSNRYIVHRELLLASPTSVSPLFISTTDIRSPKVAQIRTEPIVSVARWYPTSNSQIRIVGEARIVSAKEAGADAVFWEEKRLEHWKKMSGHMKASFARPVAPGTKLGSYEEMNDWPQRLPEMEVSGVEGCGYGCHGGLLIVRVHRHSRRVIVLGRPTTGCKGRRDSKAARVCAQQLCAGRCG